MFHSEFIKEVLENHKEDIGVTIESSLNVPQKNIETILPYVQDLIVDIKDMNPQTYKVDLSRDLWYLKNKMIDCLIYHFTYTTPPLHL